MMRLARICEIVIGMVFLVGAVMKAVNIPGFAIGIRQYQIIFDPQALQWLAIVTVVVEAALGVALLVGWRLRGLTHAVGIAMLVLFSGMIAYAWAAHGLEDCHCFGDYVPMGPGASLLKNAVMIAMLLLPWVVYARRRTPLPWSLRGGLAKAAAVVASVVVVAGAAGYGNPELTLTKHDKTDAAGARPHGAPAGPFAALTVSDEWQTHELSEGTYLAAVMNATCDHCKASVEPLNLLMEQPGMPQVVALMDGKDATLAQFRAETAPLFPTQLVPTMKWLELLGDAPAPPRYVLIQDGAVLAHWDDIVPEAQVVTAALASPPHSAKLE
jgi:hypothetical protein